MAHGYKHRRWEVFISVSASGPEASKIFEQHGYPLRSRMAADLEYTTSDVDFLYEHFSEPEPDSTRNDEKHFRLVNPSRQNLESALTDALTWLGSFSNHPDWDGGGLHFNYAGHGQEPDGALVLEDSTFSADEFLAFIEPDAQGISSPERLRLSVVLDSCHSGAWVTRILESCFSGKIDNIIPFNLFASCMEDEFAWEDSTIGHGLYTYCFSIKKSGLVGCAAEAIQPDNTFGSSLSVASGERGCSLLSAGAQNPVAYWNGARTLEVSQDSFSIFNDENEILTEAEMISELNHRRKKIRKAMEDARPDLAIGKDANDLEMKGSIRKLRKFIESENVIDRT